jgi:hypothetical protein
MLPFSCSSPRCVPNVWYKISSEFSEEITVAFVATYYD